MSEKLKPFSTALSEMRHLHKRASQTKGFTMLGLCLVALEPANVRIYTEEETALMYAIIKKRLDDIDVERKRRADLQAAAVAAVKRAP